MTTKPSPPPPDDPESAAAAATARGGAPRARNDLNVNPYSAGEQVARVAWAVVQATAFRWSPQPLRGWRRLLLRAFGARVGRGAAIHRTARIEFPWRLALGEFATIGREAWVYDVGPITIGAHATVGPRCVLCAGDHDLDDPATPLRRPPVVVGAHAWLGMGVFVGPGARLGEGCVVGAASVVFGDLPADTICHGHPARAVRPRGAGRRAGSLDA